MISRGRVRPRPGPRDDRGAATVLVLAMAGMLMFVLVGLSAATGLVTAQRRAQAAADLAALAGAAALPRGVDGCGEAARISAANGAALVACSMLAREVWVQVTVPGPQWPGRRVRVSAEARAGPALNAGGVSAG